MARALAGLLGLDDVHDPGQRVVLRGAGDFNFKRAGAVDGTGVDLGAGTDLDGNGFAGERRGIQRGAPGDDPPVGGQAFPWPDDHAIPGDQVGRGNCYLDAIAQDPGLGRNQIQQRPQATSGLGQGVFFKALGTRVEEGQHGRFLELAQCHGPDGGDRHQRTDADLSLEQASESGRHKSPSGNQQRTELKRKRYEPGASGQRDDPSGEQQHPGHRSRSDLGYLPEPQSFFGFTRFGCLVAASAGVAHRAFSFSIIGAVVLSGP